MSGKVTKASVNYRPASPLKLSERCGTCSMYRTGGGCTLVRGYIQVMAVCDRWVRR